MIRLEGINIIFDRQVIENGEISIADGKITSIIGESGSGKTSILYLIGLISSNNEYRYSFDGDELNLLNDNEMSKIRKKKIGFIFQENNLVENLSIKDNIKLSATIAGIDIDDKQVKDYLNYVKLNIKEDCYPKQLSGGERQRVAIACVLAKKTEIIIADEPTSALDAKNTELIINILKNIAYECKKKIIIATHTSKIQELSDVVYEIRDNKINLVKGKEHISITNSLSTNKEEMRNNDKNKLNLKFYYEYSKKISKKSKFQKRIMIVLCSIAIAFTSVINNFGNSFLDSQKDIMNKISDREVFVVNQTTPLSFAIDKNENLSIEDNDYRLLKMMNNIEQMYPYYEFRSSGFDIDKKSPVVESTITVKHVNEVNQYTFKGDGEQEYNKFTLIPYFPEQNFNKRIKTDLKSDIAEKIYISSELARILKVDNINSDVSLKFDVCIPMVLVKTVMNVGKEKTKYDIDIDFSKVSTLEFEVSGILEDSVENTYSNSGNNVIYVPFDILENLRTKAQSNASEYKNVSSECKEWKPSAIMLFVKDYNDIKVVKDKVIDINSNFKVLSKYQDLESMNTLLDNTKSVASLVILVVLIIIFLLMSIIHMNYTLERKYEISVLKANGLTRIELIKLIMAESTRHIFKVTIISTIISFILILILNSLFSLSIVEFGFSIVVINMLVSIISIIVPTTISLVVVNRFRPDKIMRN